eukprot:scaffold8_cov249-Pinguiococcus_pyrenoidosus.AAC.7
MKGLHKAVLVAQARDWRTRRRVQIVSKEERMAEVDQKKKGRGKKSISYSDSNQGYWIALRFRRIGFKVQGAYHYTIGEATEQSFLQRSSTVYEIRQIDAVFHQALGSSDTSCETSSQVELPRPHRISGALQRWKRPKKIRNGLSRRKSGVLVCLDCLGGGRAGARLRGWRLSLARSSIAKGVVQYRVCNRWMRPGETKVRVRKQGERKDMIKIESEYCTCFAWDRGRSDAGNVAEGDLHLILHLMICRISKLSTSAKLSTREDRTDAYVAGTSAPAGRACRPTVGWRCDDIYRRNLVPVHKARRQGIRNPHAALFVRKWEAQPMKTASPFAMPRLANASDPPLASQSKRGCISRR